MKATRWHRWLSIIVVLLIVLPTYAQAGQENAQMGSFINLQFDLSGLRPLNWQETQPDSGVYLQSQDLMNLTGLIIQVIDGPAEGLPQSLADQLDGSTTPELIESIQTDALDWSVYQFQRRQYNQDLFIDLAVAEQGSQVYLVLLQTESFSYDALHSSVFLPAVETLTAMTVYEDQATTYSVPIPRDWTVTEFTDYVTLSTDLEQAVVYIGTLDNADAEDAIVTFATAVLPDGTDLSYTQSDVQDQVDLPDLTVGITFADGTSNSGDILQGFAGVDDTGTAYIVLVSTTSQALRQWDADVDAILNGFTLPDV